MRGHIVRDSCNRRNRETPRSSGRRARPPLRTRAIGEISSDRLEHHPGEPESSAVLLGQASGRRGRDRNPGIMRDRSPALGRADRSPLHRTGGRRDRHGKAPVFLSGGLDIPYDVLSLDVGGESDLSALTPLGPRLVPVRPLPAFASRWLEIRREAKDWPGYRLIVVGGGAAGVELALGARAGLGPSALIRLVLGDFGLLPHHSKGVRRRAERALRNSGIDVLPGNAVGTPNGLRLRDGQVLKAEAVIAATGARAPAWLRSTGLSLDTQGFVAVDHFQRSVSHPEAFAAGDVSARIDIRAARSGVHAVRAGPPLAANLLAAMTGRPLRAHRPRQTRLYLLSTGEHRAIASFGPWSAEGVWVRRWKGTIDRQFLDRFALSPGTPTSPEDNESDP